jgi:phosphate transport system permease protein
MREIHVLERQQPTRPETTVRLSTVEDQTRLLRKTVADKAARLVITAGGVGIIFSIVAILFVIIAETLPLWRAPSAEQRHALDLATLSGLPPTPATAAASGSAHSMGKPLAFGVDEYQEITYVVTDAGTIDFLALADGRLVQRYRITGLNDQLPTVAYRNGLDHTVALGTAEGMVVPLTVRFSTTLHTDGTRTITPEVTEGAPLLLDPERRAISALVYRQDGDNIAAAALVGPRSLLFFAQRETRSLFEPAGVEAYRADLSGVLTAAGTALALDKYQANLLAGTVTGTVVHWQVDDPANPRVVDTFTASSGPGTGISALGWLLGDRSLVIGDTAGNVSVWFQVRDQERPEQMTYHRIHELRSHAAEVTAVAPSPRDRGFLTADATGTVFLHHATSARTLLALQAGGAAVDLITFAPKANGILGITRHGQLRDWSLSNPHPEISLKTLFGKVWYEGYDHPDYTWQSSSGSDEFEPKFSLTPLTYGTLKGTFYALLLAIPLSLCAALYTSQFMHPSLRNVVKPTVEVMAALPSVVLGFFAGLWLAPLMAEIMPAVLLMLFVLPLVTLSASFLWRLIPLSLRTRLKPGTELLFLGPVLLLAVYGCVRLNGVVEAMLFAGNFPQWLYDTSGVRYDPRNSLVVGFAMGFAVIPIIYTICEDAFSNVPQHLISGSLALGATRWQTALRVVLPTASPGVFSAIMIGFGRAVGETMIVLMATGNTPVMDFSPFNGFRALSANIAVEIPEAPHGGTLYRVLFLAALLLFVLTFLINTVAEVVRQRLRERYSRI